MIPLLKHPCLYPFIQLARDDGGELVELVVGAVAERGRTKEPHAFDSAVGHDELVGLVAFELADRDVERLGGLADQRELRNEIVRRLRAMRTFAGTSSYRSM